MYRLLFLILFLAACNNSTPKDDVANQVDSGIVNSTNAVAQPQQGDSADFAKSVASKDYHFEIIKGDNGFGYDIYSASKIAIHQPIVPGLPGNNGFKTEAEAAKVAALVMYKLQNNIMPPSITQEELDSVLNRK